MQFAGFFLILLGIIGLGLALGVFDRVHPRRRPVLAIIGAIAVVDIIIGATFVMTNIN
jgi:hypothetical protein